MFPFPSEVYAMPPAAAEGGGASAFVQFVPFILIFLIFWFLIIRPQQKRAKAHRQLLADLRKGDEVKTDSGIHGTITKLGEDTVTLEIASKVAVRVDRARIGERLSARTQPEARDEAESTAKKN